MIEDGKRTLAYLCPDCHQSVAVERSAFQLAAAPSDLACPCGKASLKVEMMGDKIRITVPCIFCEKDHKVVCSSRAFFHEKVLAFSCALSGMDCCYIGEEDAVFLNLARLEEAVDKMETEEEERQFLDELVMFEVMSEVKEIAQRDGISCTCGSRKWSMRVRYSSLELMCGDCGGVLRIPAGCAEDITEICCQETLCMHQRETRKKD